MRSMFAAFSFLTLPLVFASCQSGPTHMYPQALTPGNIAMVEVAQSTRQWTGIGVSHSGRIFVNYPRWSDDVPVSVAELKHPSNWSSELVPVAFPNPEWQQYSAGADPRSTLVCVQSVVVDDQDFLWIVDAGAPKMGAVVAGGAKLLKVDLHTNQVIANIAFDAPAINAHSYLNDVRVDVHRQIAYLTDSGDGAIIVVDLASGTARRVLANDPSTHSEHETYLINGKPWLRDGKAPAIDVDGIALSADGSMLYYHALTSRHLFRIQTEYLLDPHLTDSDVARHVEPLGSTGPCDGMEFDSGQSIFLADAVRSAVVRFTRELSTGLDRTEILVQSPDLAWPDSFAIGPDGGLYVTTSQIHLQPNPPGPYRIFKLVRKQK